MLKQKIFNKAREIGFASIGIAKAHLSEHAQYLNTWLNKEYHGSMKWIENHFDKRVDPRKLVPDAKTIIVVADSYRQKKDQGGKYIARYAQGKDYHVVLKNRLHLLFNFIKELDNSTNGRVFVDSAPVLEHYWAEQSGVGWIGKNTLTITRNAGSFVFLGEIILNLDLPADEKATNHCGTCTACLDACPTEAFIKPYVLDANKCISYLTIEHRNDFTQDQAQSIGEHTYGCDICIEVCPWNNKINTFRDSEYGNLPIDINDIHQIDIQDKEDFDKKYQDSPITRAGFEGLKRNVKAVMDNLDM